MLLEFKRVMCPIQFDQSSMAALGVAKQIVQQNKGKLFVMHAVATHADPTLISGAAMTAHDEKIAEKELARVKQEELADIDHEIFLRIGHPAEEIAKAEQEFNIDLVVMATHGRTGVTHLILGSVAERVVRESSCPVLTIRPK